MRKLLAIMLVVISLPFDIITAVFRTIHTSIVLIVHLSEGKTFLQFAEETANKNIDQIKENVEYIKEMNEGKDD